VRAIDGRQGNTLTVVGEQRGDRLGRKGRKQHLPLPKHLLHDAILTADDVHGVLKGKQARDMRRCDFADAVADHGIWDNTPMGQKRRQRDLDRKNCRLSNQGRVQAGIRCTLLNLFQQGPAEARAKERITLAYDSTKWRFA
jgi:hypothetical protein